MRNTKGKLQCYYTQAQFHCSNTRVLPTGITVAISTTSPHGTVPTGASSFPADLHFQGAGIPGDLWILPQVHKIKYPFSSAHFQARARALRWQERTVNYTITPHHRREQQITPCSRNSRKYRRLIPPNSIFSSS
jgi:hypothetical protein